MMGTGGLLNFHLSVGSYLEYYPGGLTGILPTFLLHSHSHLLVSLVPHLATKLFKNYE